MKKEEEKLSLEKGQFSNIFLFTVLLLMTLPFFISSQELITSFLDFTRLSVLIQNYITPAEVKFVLVMLHFVGIKAIGDSHTIALTGSGGSVFRAEIIWSCIGWQSLLLIVFTLLSGLRGSFTPQTKAETIIIGLFGTFWVNILRIFLIYVVGFYFGQNSANLFHNIFGTIVTVAWVFFFWWFSYKFLLEEKRNLQT